MITDTLIKCLARVEQGGSGLMYSLIYGFNIIFNLTLCGLQAAATS